MDAKNMRCTWILLCCLQMASNYPHLTASKLIVSQQKMQDIMLSLELQQFVRLLPYQDM